MADLDFSDLLKVGDDIAGSAERIAGEAYPLVKGYAHNLQQRWRENARDTAGKHGKHYPRSITAEQVPSASAIEWEIGPDRAFKQGSMGEGFEYGSVNQPPHLDGARATAAIEPEFQAAVEKLAASL